MPRPVFSEAYKDRHACYKASSCIYAAVVAYSMMVSAVMLAIICFTHVPQRAFTYEQKVNTMLNCQPYKAFAVMMIKYEMIRTYIWCASAAKGSGTNMLGDIPCSLHI